MIKNKFFVILSIIISLIFVTLFVGIQAQTSETDIIGMLSDRAHFKYPRSIFVDDDEKKMIVADTGNGLIKILNKEGEYIGSFGEDFSMYPTKVIKDSGSRYIVCDPENGRISFFDRRGEFIDNMHFSENPECGVIRPISLTYNSKGEMLVLDNETSQVKVFGSTGMFLFSVSREGSEDGELLKPVDLTTDTNDDVYVVDNGNNRICVFNSVGNFIKNIGSGELSSPSAICVTGNNVYVSDTGNSQIKVFSKSGSITKTIGEFGIESGQYRYPTGFVVEDDGSIWVSDTGNSRIQKIKNDKHILTVGLEGSALWPKGLKATDNYIFVAESSSDAVNVYSAETGEHIISVGSQGTSSTNLKKPEDCDISTRGDLVVCDTGNSRIQIYSLDGDHLFGFGGEGDGPGEFRNPGGIGIDRDSGNIYVADTGNSRIVSVSMSGTWIDSIDEKLTKPTDVAIDTQGNVWVVDEELGEVLIFNPEGDFEKSLTDEAFSKPTSITIDEFGRVFICDAGVSNIRVFSESGIELGSFGEYGGPLTDLNAFSEEKNTELLNKPNGISIHGTHAYISDTANSRIVRVPLSKFGGLPRLFVDTEEITFSKVPLSTKRSQIIHVINNGNGTISGTIEADQDWVEITPNEFDGEAEITVWVNGEKAREGLREAEITVISNGGIFKIPVSSNFFSGTVKRIVMMDGHNNIEANGKEIYVYPSMYIDKNYFRRYVHFRFIGEELGAKVTYDGRYINYFLEGKTLKLKIDSKEAVINGEKTQANSPAYLFNKKYPVVPLRFVVESLGASLMNVEDKFIVEYP